MTTGLFWDQEVDAPKKRYRPLAPIPDTGWKPPTHFPDLSSAKAIAIDTETYDPELIEKGAGWARGVGHIVGISIATDDGFYAYYPIRHEVEPWDNLDPTTVLRWLSDVLGDARQPKLGANITYDVGWLRQEGVIVRGLLHDVQSAEALLDEASKVALEVLAQKYAGQGKVSDVLYQWCSASYGGAVNGKQRANIYRTPPRLTGFYAESDAYLLFPIFAKQYPMLHAEGLWEVYMMETELIYLMIDMRFEGVTVDIPEAEKLHVELDKEIIKQSRQLDEAVGFATNVNAPESLKQIFELYKIPYSLTDKGNPSFTKAFLGTVDHPIGKFVVGLRKLMKFNSTFIEGSILNSHINGKVFSQFHQLRGDGGGTRSGRYSSSTPNIQQVPSRDKVWGPKIRGLFVPDQGHVAWRKYDYSQIEYRFLAHFAVGDGADGIRTKFRTDPNADYHQAVIDLVKQEACMTLDRKPAKTINFGLLYGMGLKKLSESLGLSMNEAKPLFEAYHTGVPFAQATMNHYSEEAAATGKIRTIMGRLSRFDLWQLGKYADKDEMPLKYEHALRKWGGNIQRASTHKAVNRLLQGSAADMMKKGMLQCYKDGVFAETGIPRLTVHDELNWSDVGGKDSAFAEAKRIMETCLPLRVPIKVDAEIGPNWGNVKEIK